MIEIDKAKKNTYIIAAVALVALVVGVYFLFIFKKSASQIKPKSNESSLEVKQLSDIELSKRPYVTLTPTSDGAEIILSIENMGAFDKIEYELIYQADNPTAPGTKIPRGATGSDVNTKDQKYKKSILLGTASRGVRSPDRGIVEGKLNLHSFKGEQEYLSETPWSIDLIGAKAATLTDPSGNMSINVPGLGKDYWVVLAETVGVPTGGKFDIKKVQLPVYGVFSIAGQFVSAGTLQIKAPNGAELYSYSHQDNNWQKVDATVNGSNLEAKVSSFATFVVVSSK